MSIQEQTLDPWTKLFINGQDVALRLLVASTSPMPSNQLVAIGIMFCIPSLQFSIRHPYKLMSNSSVFLVHNALLPDRITLPFRNEVDPEVVVNSAEGDTGDGSV
jgi:hypothetical protein